MSFSKFTLALVICYLVLCSAMCWYSYNQTAHNWEAFAKLAGVGATLITSLAAGAIALFTASKASELEKTKLMLNEELQKFQLGLNRDLELFKKGITIDIEFIKNKLAAERTGYTELYNALANYYYILSIAETGKVSGDSVNNADLIMIAAQKHLIIADPFTSNIVLAFWQQARNTKEAMEAAGKDTNSVKLVWKNNAGELGKLLEAFKTASAKHLQQSPGV